MFPAFFAQTESTVFVLVFLFFDTRTESNVTMKNTTE